MTSNANARYVRVYRVNKNCFQQAWKLKCRLPNFSGCHFLRATARNAKRSVLSRSGVFRIWQKGDHGERAEREPITGVWGRSPQRGPGAEPLIGGQGAKPPEAETLFAFERSTEAANSPIFLKFVNAENHRYLRCFSQK